MDLHIKPMKTMCVMCVCVLCLSQGVQRFFTVANLIQLSIYGHIGIIVGPKLEAVSDSFKPIKSQTATWSKCLCAALHSSTQLVCEVLFENLFALINEQEEEKTASKTPQASSL